MAETARALHQLESEISEALRAHHDAIVHQVAVAFVEAAAAEHVARNGNGHVHAPKLCTICRVRLAADQRTVCHTCRRRQRNERERLRAEHTAEPERAAAGEPDRREKSRETQSVRCATIGRVGRPTVITRRIEEQLAAMRDAGVTQERAAIACNIGRRTVQRWEARRGREPEPQTLEEVLASLPTLEEIMADDRPRPLGRRRRSRKRDWQKAARMLEQEAPERWDLR